MQESDEELLKAFVATVKRLKRRNPEARVLKISDGTWEAIGKPDILLGIRIVPSGPRTELKRKKEKPNVR